ncbi:hypothetical protein [Pseudonocardia asaccharolytica]|uniref:Uncharacterized protein n=1 Tax=Pseudonocardia asaccharolytica DSM 44247 = NBRC 16224 TaxID=1123024 RepID=A0A511DAI8_9PSEU|nr:hypothetical protein [Pseudonocardia asaccharolytica]GEL19968.1 hypothetical protein PA7_38050 [Pseudonocardia asaccharolytica DSM 44247 = NBRC 16224]
MITPESLVPERTVVALNLKKILTLLGVALVVFFIVTQPTGAANALGNIGTILRDAANSVTSFFTQVVS